MKWAYGLLVFSTVALLIGFASNGFGLTTQSLRLRLAGVTSPGDDDSAVARSSPVTEQLSQAAHEAPGDEKDGVVLKPAAGASARDFSAGISKTTQAAVLAGICVVLALPIVARGQDEMLVFGVTTVAYLFSSILMSLLNKALIVISQAPYGILLFQFVFAVVAIAAVFGPRTLGEADPKNLWRWGLLVVPFTGMLVSSLLALQSGTVSLLVVVRGIVPLMALVVESLLRLHQASEVTWQGVASLTCILVGVVSFVATDVQVNLIGLGWCIANVFCTLASRVMERALLVDESMNLSFAAMNLLNNLLGVVPATVLWLPSSESNPIPGLSLDNLTDRSFDIGLLMLSGVLGITVGWYGIAVQAQVTATSMAVFQAISRVITVLLAAWFLSETVTVAMWSGFILTIVGGSWYKLRGERPVESKAVEET